MGLVKSAKVSKAAGKFAGPQDVDVAYVFSDGTTSTQTIAIVPHGKDVVETEEYDVAIDVDDPIEVAPGKWEPKTVQQIETRTRDVTRRTMVDPVEDPQAFVLAYGESWKAATDAEAARLAAVAELDGMSIKG